MCRNATSVLRTMGAAVPLGAVLVSVLAAQAPPASTRSEASPQWRRIGNAALDLNLPDAATGPVARVWYSPDGARLLAMTASGRIFETQDSETWREIRASAPVPPADAVAPSRPERSARIFAAPGNPARLYGLGGNAWRSEDGGANWANLTGYREATILGGGLADLAVSPRDPDEIVVASRHGVWRSVDGGQSWTGMNQGLPNLPVRRLTGLPVGARGARILIGGSEFEWKPGEKAAWRLADANATVRELGMRQWLSALLGAEITAQAAVADTLYAGSSDGRLWASPDHGRSWRPFGNGEAGPVLSIFADSREPRLAIAALGRRAGETRSPHVLRTFNGGIFWDDWSSNLPDAPVYAIAADRASGGVYAASEAGVFYTIADPLTPGPSTNWIPIGSRLPAAPALDVKLDAAGNQLYAALDGYGIYATLAPHRLRDIRAVNAADFSVRAAAPGSLLSILGAKVQSAKAGNLTAPVLAASETQSQIQVPFEAGGNSFSLALEAASGRYQLGVPLDTVSPAIFVSPDGTPMLLDADSGMVLESSAPARANGRIQILATGLGRVRPEWPTGLAAPLENAPVVIATVKAYLDGVPLTVSRSTLAPGLVGFYLIELQLPAVVNDGPAELHVDVEGRQSNSVLIFVEQ